MHQQNISDQYDDVYNIGGTTSGSQILPWGTQNFNPTQITNRVDPFLIQTPPISSYAGLFNRRLQQQYGGFGLGFDAELQKMSAQEIMDAKAVAASKNHSEAERRRRERINNHLAKLRSLLPNTTKTDKASLLAEVIQHVKELKRQTSVISETSLVPTEIDELMVDNASDGNGRLLIKASICCEDRSDLLSDLIKTLKAFKLRTLKAEITTLGGRVKNVLFVTGEESNDDEIDDVEQQQQYYISTIHEALRSVMERSNGDESGSGSVKRQRTNINIVDHRSFY